MIVRKGTFDDVEAVLEIYESSKRFMRAKGNDEQWINGYPAREDVIEDIEKGQLFVGEDNDGEIVMCFAYIMGNDPTYDIIEDGEWLNDEPYGTVHRIASSGKCGGMMEACRDFCLQKVPNLRIDTHEKNAPMLNALERLEFKRCGIIYCRDGSPRIAFQFIS